MKSSSLFADYIEGDERARRILGGGADEESLLLRAHLINRGEIDSASAKVITEQSVFLPQDAARETSLASLSAGALVVCAGQQPGLFGGPLLSLYKAATATALARKLSQEGFPSVAVFWNASEDHDFNEANRFFLPPTVGSPESVIHRLATGPRRGNNSLADITLNSEDLLTLSSWNKVPELGSNCLPLDGESIGTWNSRLIAEVTAGSGLLVVEPHWFAEQLTELRQELLLRREELAAVFQSITEAIAIEGFSTPLKMAASEATFLFLATKTGRQRIDGRGEDFLVDGKVWTRESMLEKLHTRPQDFSSSAASRPLAQQVLFPIVAQVAGPTESNYMAQLFGLYHQLALPRPLVWPRASFRISGPVVASLMDELGVSSWPPKEFADAVDSLENEDLLAIEAALKRVLAQVDKLVDPDKKRLMIDYRRRLMHDFRNLKKEWAKEVRHKTKATRQKRKRLAELTWPRGIPQERAYSAVSLQLDESPGFFARLIDAVDIGHFSPTTIHIDSEIV